MGAVFEDAFGGAHGCPVGEEVGERAGNERVGVATDECPGVNAGDLAEGGFVVFVRGGISCVEGFGVWEKGEGGEGGGYLPLVEVHSVILIYVNSILTAVNWNSQYHISPIFRLYTCRCIRSDSAPRQGWATRCRVCTHFPFEQPPTCHSNLE